MDKTALTTAKRKAKAIQALSGWLVFGAGFLGLTGCDVWKGFVGGSRLRGLSTPIVSRQFHPADFWTSIALTGFIGLLLVALGIRSYFKILHPPKT